MGWKAEAVERIVVEVEEGLQQVEVPASGQRPELESRQVDLVQSSELLASPEELSKP